MLTQKTIVGVLCVLGLAMTGCTGRDSTTSAARTTNSDIETSIRNHLGSNPALKDIDVSADADKNQVTLSGRVETQAQRTQALEAVSAVNRSLQVTDKIDVKPREIARSEYTEDMAREARQQAQGTGEKIGSSLDDAWIHTKISSSLLVNRDTPTRKINVDVVNGVVTLRGAVDTMLAKTEAERIAKETDGVKRVVNRLTTTTAQK